MTFTAYAINSKDNPKLKMVRGLLEHANVRKKEQQSVLEGTHLIDAFLKQNGVPHSVWVSDQAIKLTEVDALLAKLEKLCPVYVIPHAFYREMSQLGQGFDVLAVINTQQKPLPVTLNDNCLILEQVQDAGNVGTILRTAAAAGFKHILAIKGCAGIYSPKVLRAGMGAHFNLTIYEGLELTDALNSIQTPIYVTSSYAQSNLYQLNLKQPVCFILGNEGQGASPAAMQAATAIGIPQPGGEESLNVAIAAAVCMYEAVRQNL